VLLGMIVIIPSIIAYIFGLLFSADISIIGRYLPTAPSECVLWNHYFACSGGCSFLPSRRYRAHSRYVAAFWIALILVGHVVSSVLEEAHRHELLRSQASSSFTTEDDQVARALEASKSDWRSLVPTPKPFPARAESARNRKLLGAD